MSSSFQRLKRHMQRKGVIATSMVIIRHIGRPIVVFFLNKILYFLDYLTKEKDVVLFGTKPFGNIKQDAHYMYEWMVENRQDIDIFWIAHTKAQFHELNQKGYPVKYSKSLGGIGILLRAKVSVASRGDESIAFHKKIVPDRITRMRIGGIPFQMSKHKESDSDDFNADYRLASSDFEIDLRQKKRPERNPEYVITGKPKYDIMLDPPNETKLELESFFEKKGIENNKKIILYAPTRRSIYNSNKKNINFFPFDDFNVDYLSEFLDQEDLVLLIRPHYKDEIKMDNCESEEYERAKTYLTNLVESSPNIISVYPSEFSDTNTLLHSTDILLTDYSSIWHEYLLLDRPMIFMPYDIKMFSDYAGCMYDYQEMTPGPKVQSFKEWTDHIEKISAGDDPYRTERQEIKKKFHKYGDGSARKRIMDLIEKEIGGSYRTQ